MTDEYMYIKKRGDFGRCCSFDDRDGTQTGFLKGTSDLSEQYVEKTVCSVNLDNVKSMSQHSVNTVRVKMESRIMEHDEGGWPENVEATEAQDTNKYRKRLEKTPQFEAQTRSLTMQATECLEMNNTMDLFEHYFHEEEPQHLPEILSMKTVALFKDPGGEDERSVTKICWHPDNTKMVCAYSNLRFQYMTDEMPMSSFIWDIRNCNEPCMELRTESPLTCCQYNWKQQDLIAAGCYSGILNIYDVRSRDQKPSVKTKVEESHYDPIYDVMWLNSKSGTECCTVSSDGQLMFWDTRKLEEPLDKCTLTDGNKEDPMTLGGVSLEWAQEAGPTKYLVGTEHGLILQCTKKPKKDVEVNTWYGSEERGGYGKHFGPVYAIKRNPVNMKYFMTVGDWCCKMWMEDLKGPIWQTPYCPSFLSCGCWSPQRSGVFFLCRQDGRIDVWDFFYRMNEVSLSHKVSDFSLTSMNLQPTGNLLAVGDADGVITLLKVCDTLVQNAPGEKASITAMFEREQRRERNLEAIKKVQGLKQGGTVERTEKGLESGSAEFRDREEAFFNATGVEPAPRE